MATEARGPSDWAGDPYRLRVVNMGRLFAVLLGLLYGVASLA